MVVVLLMLIVAVHVAYCKSVGVSCGTVALVDFPYSWVLFVHKDPVCTRCFAYSLSARKLCLIGEFEVYIAPLAVSVEFAVGVDTVDSVVVVVVVVVVVGIDLDVCVCTTVVQDGV